MATYDVTAISHQRDYTPLAASVPARPVAEEVARTASAAMFGDQTLWSAVQVKEAHTGQIVATYVAGVRQPT